jgi:nucleotide-binding universal stress UspA family protein
MPNISRILCPVDFSETSTHAVEQAAVIAGWYNARLTALHVDMPIFAPVPGLPADAVATSELERLRTRMTSFLAAALASGVGVDVTIDVGHPAARILERAAGLPADLIVMGTHGAGGLERFVIGSVTERVLRKATCPVLTVPPRAHATSTFRFTRVLCAVDFSDWSSAALDLASSLARESGASLVLLHVIEWAWNEPPAPVFAELPPEQSFALAEFRRYLEKSAASRLESLVSHAVRDRCAVTARVSHGKPYVEILRAAAADGADLIVMGVHGRTPIDLAVFGSTTNHVVRRATCPVLTLRR